MIYVNPEICWHVPQAVLPEPAPTSTYNSPLRGVQNVRAPLVLDAVRAYGGKPAPMWKVFNSLAMVEKRTGHRPIYRPERRWTRLAYWRAARQLIGVGLLYRHRGLISTAPIAFKPKLRMPRPTYKRVRNFKTPVVAANAENDGSNGTDPLVGQTMQAPQAKLTSVKSDVYYNQITKAPVEETQSARPSLEQIRAAASLIAMRPRPRRRRKLSKFTGWFQGERIRRWSLFELPTGETLPAMIVRRGYVYVKRPEGAPGPFLERLRASEVQLVKNPAAVLLGKLKFGKKERASAVKAASARLNGCKPCRPGRKRGRPKMAAAPQIRW